MSSRNRLCGAKQRACKCVKKENPGVSMSAIRCEVENERALEELLAEGVDGAIARERSTFDEFAGPFGRDIVLFGAGNLGRRTLRKLREEGIEPLAFLDNDSARW